MVFKLPSGSFIGLIQPAQLRMDRNALHGHEHEQPTVGTDAAREKKQENI